jgi:hypothetical protein
MAIHTHFIAASASGKPFHFQKLQSFLRDLLREDIVRMPVALFVGDAQNDPQGAFWGSKYASHAIVPNSPGSMLELGEEEEFPIETFRYYGEEEELFFATLQAVPFAEKNCCICFDTLGLQWSEESWEGAVIYILVRPMLIHFPNSFGSPSLCTPIHHGLDHFFIMYSSTGALVENAFTTLKPLIAPVLERYFGSDLIMEQAME